ncbi:MAG: hypothetical protein RML36_04515 [Anaerolineae bacterium]|nr:hypothetical protein [Anaerolineae bacterium]MDW8098736.1 hypothetical protein [Anaerolineae bacterium]
MTWPLPAAKWQEPELVSNMRIRLLPPLEGGGSVKVMIYPQG